MLSWLVLCGAWLSLHWFSQPQGHRATAASLATKQSQSLLTKRIEDVKLGERVAGANPLREQVEGYEPDQKTWRKISLQMQKESGHSLCIDLLRPVEWIEYYNAKLGYTIELDLPEMGAAGPAEVTAVGPCPEIQPGTGAVVTGKFVHQVDAASSVLRIQLEGDQEITGVTSNHPYWSEDRQEFIEAGDLHIGELVDTQLGHKRIESITPDSTYAGLVYNLETTEHVYRVGLMGTLVHNSCLNQGGSYSKLK